MLSVKTHFWETIKNAFFKQPPFSTMTTLDRKLFAAFQDQFAFSTQPRGLFVWVNRKAFLSHPKALGDARPPLRSSLGAEWSKQLSG